jgi:hypothetical protein
LPQLFCHEPLLPSASVPYLHHSPHNSPLTHTSLIDRPTLPVILNLYLSSPDILLGPPDPWRWRQYVPWKHQHCSTIRSRNRDLNHTTMKTSASQIWHTFAAVAHDCSWLKSVEAVTSTLQKCFGLCRYLALNACHLTSKIDFCTHIVTIRQEEDLESRTWKLVP